MKKNKLDKFYYHEALDRTFCITDIIETILITHPVVSKHKKIKKKIIKAQRLLLEAYEMIGNKG